MDDEIPDGYKMTKLGALPEEWEVTKLGDICNIKMGQSPPSSSYNDNSNGLPFFQGNADFGTKYPIVKSYCNNPLKIAEIGDILMSVRAPVGAINISNVTCCIGRGLTAINADKNNSQAFMYYLLQSCVGILNKFATGSTFTAINQKELNILLIARPPLPEQCRIAIILSTLDETVEHTEALIEKYRNIKAGLMADLLTRGIDEEGRIRSEETHRFKDSALGMVPEEWEIGTLSDIAHVNPKSDISKLFDNSLVTFLSMPDVGENGKIHLRQTRKLYEVKTGFTRFTENDILFAKITPCMENGKGALATELINKVGFGSTEFHVLRANQSGSPEFIYYVTQSKKFRLKSEGNMTGSAGQQRVPADFFKKYQIPLPPLQEQRRIAEILTAADQRIEKEETFRDKLLQLKKGLMQDLLTGKVRVKSVEIEA